MSPTCIYSSTWNTLPSPRRSPRPVSQLPAAWPGSWDGDPREGRVNVFDDGPAFVHHKHTLAVISLDSSFPLDVLSVPPTRPALFQAVPCRRWRAWAGTHDLG